MYFQDPTFDEDDVALLSIVLGYKVLWKNASQFHINNETLFWSFHKGDERDQIFTHLAHVKPGVFVGSDPFSDARLDINKMSPDLTYMRQRRAVIEYFMHCGSFSLGEIGPRKRFHKPDILELAGKESLKLYWRGGAVSMPDENVYAFYLRIPSKNFVILSEQAGPVYQHWMTKGVKGKRENPVELTEEEEAVRVEQLYEWSDGEERCNKERRMWGTFSRRAADVNRWLEISACYSD